MSFPMPIELLLTVKFLHPARWPIAKNREYVLELLSCTLAHPCGKHASAEKKERGEEAEISSTIDPKRTAPGLPYSRARPEKVVPQYEAG